MDEKEGFDCEFVKKPSSDIQSECPVCLQVIREPYQVDCCGYVFCQVCIEHIKATKEPCPCCKRIQFGIFADVRLKRSLYSLSVYCSHRKLGCLWEGELKQLDNHLNTKPSQNQQLQGCQFTQVHCFYCFQPFQRANIMVHQDKLCPMRPFSCEHCKSYDSHYEDVTAKHYLMCGSYPIQCPSNCGNTLQRETLTSHIENDCPLTTIDCDFAYVGCKVKLPRNEMPAHLSAPESIATHLSLQAKRQKQLKQENIELANKVAKLTLDLQKLQVSTPLCPVELSMYNFEQHMKAQDIWYSLPFYTHPKGYKMCLHVTAYGTDCGEGTHMSVGVALMRGEHDQKLKWPYCGIITVQLLSQEDGDHYTRIFDAPPSALAKRVVDVDRANSGWGYYKFIPHTQLLRSKYTMYDCIKVICIHQNS